MGKSDGSAEYKGCREKRAVRFMGREDRELLREQTQLRREILGELRAGRRGVGASLQASPHALTVMPEWSPFPHSTGPTSPGPKL